jgi:hypothetical protein
MNERHSMMDEIVRLTEVERRIVDKFIHAARRA